MKKEKVIALGLAAAIQLSGISCAANTGVLVPTGDFENGTDGFGIAYSGKADTTMPYIFHSEDIKASGNGALKFVASEKLNSKTSTSPQSAGFAYQGLYNVDFAEVSEGESYTVSADIYAVDSGVKLRFIQMDGNRAVAASEELTPSAGEWNTLTYKFTSGVTTDKCRIRLAFYDIKKNGTVYIDNFVFKTRQIADGSWRAIDEGTVSETADGAVLEAAADKFKNYCGAYTEVDISALPTSCERYVLCGNVTVNADAAVYVNAENIPDTFAEYKAAAGEKIPVRLELDPADCKEGKIRISVSAAADGLSENGKITLSDFDIIDETQYIDMKQSGDTVIFSGKLRYGNANREFTVRINDEPTFTKTADTNGNYSFSYALTGVSTSKPINVKISGINGYDDTEGEISGYIMAYNSALRNEIADEADKAATLGALRGVLTEETEENTGISVIKDYRLSDKDYVLNYLLGCDISDYKKLETHIRLGAKLYELSRKNEEFTDIADKYNEELDLDSVKIFADEYGNADKNGLNNLFKSCTTPLKDAADMRYITAELLLKQKLSKAVNNTEAMSVISKYAADLALDLTEYNSIKTSSKKNSAANSFIKYAKSASSFKTLQAELDDIIDNLDNSNNNGGSSGGSSSGGGFGGSYQKVDIEPIGGTQINGSASTNGTAWKFEDLAGFEWAEESIRALTDKNVISKSEDKKFRPRDYITRAEFAKLLTVAKGLKAEKQERIFDDVRTDDWYFEYVAALCENGIANGMSERYFGAGEYITRQDICVMLMRALGAESDAASAEFTDMDNAAEYAKSAIAYMSGKGFVNGYEDGSFKPNNNATRAETAKLIYCVFCK